MRLLERKGDGEFNLVEFLGDHIPCYAILSHTWGADDEEVTFKDVVNGTGKNKRGYEKIHFCAKQAAKDGLQYFWVDTCSIDKSSSAELSEAINSMFRWYREATKCYVYLSDVSIAGSTTENHISQRRWKPSFRKSRWFTRGWTLQELIAPTSVEFFSVEGERLGDRESLQQTLHEITGISIRALQGSPLSSFSVDERMSWAAKRETKRAEDAAYSLLGLFDIQMPLLYGEGRQKAFNRLQKEINSESPNDQSTYPKDKVPWLVPFERDPNFVGREEELKKLDDKFSSLPSAEICQRVAVWGLGGCGKTALAVEFAHRIRKQHPDRAVYWVPAISHDTFNKAYRDIGMLLQIPGITDDKANVMELVRRRLDNEDSGEWLMIVDNADDVDILFKRTGDDEKSRLIDYLPSSRKGMVFFTTRNRKAAVKQAPDNVLELTQMSSEEAKAFLTKAIRRKEMLHDDKMIDTFLQLLTYLPLAIIQAAAFFNENDITFSEYISLYGGTDEDIVEVLSKDFEDRSRYTETKNPVLTTWCISFNQLQKHDPLAAEYLSFMACLLRENIPLSLLPHESSKVKKITAIGTLTAYAFISERQQRQGEKAFDVHRLVHLATRNWLKTNGQWDNWAEKVLTRLVEALPFGGHKGRETWIAYLPHAIHFIELSEIAQSKKAIELLNRIGRCQHTLGQYGAAKETYRGLLQIRQSMLGKKHPDTLISMYDIGFELHRQGNHIDAEKMLRETLALQETVLGKQHRDTLTSMQTLAVALTHQGKYGEAEKMLRETLALQETVLGKEHHDTLACMHAHAEALNDQGKHGEAEKMLRETLALQETVLGKEHPHTLASRHGLAKTLHKQGKCGEAEKMLRETLAQDEIVLGKEHPNTLASRHDLAKTLYKQGKYGEAEKMLRESMALEETVLGKEHPDTLVCMHNLASALHRQGKYGEAEKMLREALVLEETVLGKEHPKTLITVYSLAYLLQQQGQYEHALLLYQRAYGGLRKTLGFDHPTTRTCLRHYISCQTRKINAVKSSQSSISILSRGSSA